MKLSLVNLVPLEEMDMNDPVMMRARASQMKADKEAKRKANRIDGNEAMYLRGEIADLKDEIKQIYIDMEQEAEPEGGSIADMYGDLLNKAEAKLADMQSKLDDYDMNEYSSEGEGGDEDEIEIERDGNIISVKISVGDEVRYKGHKGKVLKTEYDGVRVNFPTIGKSGMTMHFYYEDLYSKEGYYQAVDESLNEEMGEWPKELTSRHSDGYRFELEKITPTYQDKPGRAKYRVIDIETGELKGTPVFGKIKHLMAYAGDLIKPQGGTQSSNFGESLNEKDNNEEVVKMVNYTNDILNKKGGIVRRIEGDNLKVQYKLGPLQVFQDGVSYEINTQYTNAKGEQINNSESKYRYFDNKRDMDTLLSDIKLLQARDMWSKKESLEKMMNESEDKWNAIDVSRKAEKEIGNKEWNERTTKKLDMLIALNKAGKFKKDFDEERLQGWVDQNYSWEKLSRQFKVNEGSCGYGPNGKPGNTPGGTRGMSADDRTRGMFRKLIQKEIKKLSETDSLDDKLRGALGDKDFEKVINKPVPSFADMKPKPSKDKK
mgnify:CR=1 FL=1